MRFLLALLFFSGGAAAQDLCSDYLSATWGTVVKRQFDECSGHGLTVKTDFSATHEDKAGPVFVRYAHVEPYESIVPGLKLKPGDPIGTTIPLRRTRCHGSREHVHYELRVLNNARRHIDPHAFWVDGPGKISCYTDGMTVPRDSAVAPIRCKP